MCVCVSKWSLVNITKACLTLEVTDKFRIHWYGMSHSHTL